MRYCPLCNRRTLVVEMVYLPFVMHVCASCGFIHKIVDAEKQAEKQKAS